jgi:flagellar basal-body rod protein FlgG
MLYELYLYILYIKGGNKLRALWTASTGMEGQQVEIDNIANNLANTNTTGYKESRVNFEDLFYQTIKSPGAYSSEYTQVPTGIQLGLGSKVSSIEKEFTQGDLQQTSNPLDLAIEGQGFFQIQMANGQTAYTRDGTLQTNSQGQLVNATGYTLVPPITIPPNATSITIAQDGTVSAAVSGQTNPVQVGTITLTNFINPAGLNSIGHNLYLQTSASGVPEVGTPGQNGLGTIQQGFLEMSNVNLVGQMVSMITAQNAYTIDSKAITIANQMLQTAASLVP